MVDPQTRHSILTIGVALALALLREPRGRRLLTMLKGPLIGAVIGVVVSVAPLMFLELTHPGPMNEIQRWLLKVAAVCGIFYGLTLGATVVSIVFVVFEVRWWWQRSRTLMHPVEPDTPPSPPAPSPPTPLPGGEGGTTDGNGDQH